MSLDKSAVTGDLAQRNIYSAVIKNQTSDKIHCIVEYRTVTGTDNELVEFDVDGNGEEHKCEQKVLTTTTNNSDPSFSNIFPKVIYSLQIQKSNGDKVRLCAPFENVPREDVRNWKFIVDNDQIHSEKS